MARTLIGSAVGIGAGRDRLRYPTGTGPVFVAPAARDGEHQGDELMCDQASLAQRRSATVFALSVACVALVATTLPPKRTHAGEGPWMSEDEMHATFTGVTLEGKYGSGRPFSEIYQKDGSLEYREAANLISGKWSVQAGTFCTIYDNDPSGGCYRVKKVGGNCYEFYFVARTEQQVQADPKRPAWTARGSVVGKPGICAEQHNV
ncbi:MAG: hypothetical protein AB7U75_06185 [Hyphomicrobiaceae bacterium]